MFVSSGILYEISTIFSSNIQQVGINKVDNYDFVHDKVRVDVNVGKKSHQLFIIIVKIQKNKTFFGKIYPIFIRAKNWFKLS